MGCPGMGTFPPRSPNVRPAQTARAVGVGVVGFWAVSVRPSHCVVVRTGVHRQPPPFRAEKVTELRRAIAPLGSTAGMASASRRHFTWYE